MKYLYVLVFAALVVFAGCSQTTSPETDSAVSYIGSEAELSALLAQSSSSSYGVEQSFMRSGTDMAVSESASAPAQDGDFSSTNVQEVGVDEADIFKTDGSYIYTASENTLFITSVGEGAEVLSRTNTEMNVQGLFLEDDYVVVIGSKRMRGDVDIMRSMIWPAPSQNMVVRVFDVSDRTSPYEVKNVEFEGWYVDARLKDSTAYIVSNSGVSSNRPIPMLRVDGVESSIEPSRIAYFPISYNNPQLTTVHTLDLESLSLVSDGVITESTQTVYMRDYLYLSSTSFVNEYEIRQETILRLGEGLLTSEDRNLVSRIRSVDEDILSSSQKKQRILEVIERRVASLSQDVRESFIDEVDAAVKAELDRHEYREHTNIAKFAVSSDGISAVSSGQVPGRVYDSFGFGEDGEVLRVVTTTSGVWDDGKLSRESENHVFSLDNELVVLDSIMGLAPGESIFSARYEGDRLYMVTFEQIDPFFVIDVSDNENLRVLGELKITGFSRYLHPVSDDVVLGLGREATETGRQIGLKISLFDVSDVSNPVELTKWVSDDRFASSSAEWDHKAFLLDVDKELLVIPVNSWDRNNRYSGAYVFNVSEQHLSLRGLVEHSSQVERSAWIGSDLYTKSSNLLRINAIDDLSSVANLELRVLSDSDVPVY